MPARDDPYADPYRDSRDGPDDDARPELRRATQPARPAWDAMTYGRPDDTRRPVRRREEPAPAPYDPDTTRNGSEPPPYEPSPYGPPAPYEPSPYGPPAPYEPASYDPYPAGSPTYPPPADAYRPAGPHRGAEAYPGAAEPYRGEDQYPGSYDYPGGQPYPPSDTYPADTYAPDAYTSFRAESPPPTPELGRDEQPVYVASGLYLDDERGAPGWAGDPTRSVGPYPRDGRPQPTDESPRARATKAERNLFARTWVGLLLGAVVLSSLFVWRPAFLAVIAAAVVVAVWELVRAIGLSGVHPPLVPLVAGGVLMTGLAWFGGSDGLTFGLIVTVLAVMVWRFAHGPEGYGRDVTLATLVAVYVPFLAGFAAMMASADDGHLRVLALLIVVVLSDTGGYLVGRRLGRTKMAPSVSPGKTWEGLGGSIAAAAVGSVIVLWILLDVSLGWGLLFGLVIAVVSVVGDLGESLVKRDLGVKDMSSLLPGHGGLMDRLDSILLAAPAGFLMLSAFAPVAA